MPEGNSHGKNLIGTSQIELVVKLLILRVVDFLANDTISATIIRIAVRNLTPPSTQRTAPSLRRRSLDFDNFV
jgi:hypothetical protein